MALSSLPGKVDRAFLFVLCPGMFQEDDIAHFTEERTGGMYKLTTEGSFDAAHFLAGYEGKCKNIHGHRWRVVATIAGEQLKNDQAQRGMLVDFGDLKKDLKQLLRKLDHSLIIEKDSLKQKTMEALKEEDFKLVVVDFRPTAENFSKYFYGQLKEMGYLVSVVQVYETPNNCASYEE